MNVLCIGDVVGNCGCKALLKTLPKLKKEYNVDLCIVNGENSAEGNGILPGSAEAIFSAGADVVTGGNHTIHRREIYEILESNNAVLRPANYPAAVPGSGYCEYDLGRHRIAVINILGTVYLDSLESPFDTADRLIKKADDNGIKIKIIDFHAEATSEKRALGLYLDGRVSAIFGTHTHVQTADEQVLTGGTGYITDIGMTGAHDSVLGVEKDIIINRFRTHLPERFKNAYGEATLCGVLFNIDEKSGKTTAIQRIVLHGISV